MRANVYKRASKEYLAKAHVKVIGEGNKDFIAGDTDLRVGELVTKEQIKEANAKAEAEGKDGLR